MLFNITKLSRQVVKFLQLHGSSFSLLYRSLPALHAKVPPCFLHSNELGVVLSSFYQQLDPAYCRAIQAVEYILDFCKVRSDQLMLH